MRDDLFAYGAEGSDSTVTALYLSANHLVVDFVSWNVLIAAIHEAYEEISPIDNEVDYSFGAWTQAMQDTKDPSAETLDYWGHVLAKTADATRKLEQLFTQGAPERQLFRVSTPSPLNPPTEASVYTIVLRALDQAAGATHSGVLIETHGRYGELFDINLSQTVGWFTQLIPLAGDTDEDIEAILRLDDMTKLAYGIGTQRGMVNPEMEPRVIVNYLGKSNMSGYSMRHGLEERPIDKELMELSIYEDAATLHVELILYATPKDPMFGQKLLDAITQQFTASKMSLEESRLQAILDRIGVNNG